MFDSVKVSRTYGQGWALPKNEAVRRTKGVEMFISGLHMLSKFPTVGVSIPRWSKLLFFLKKKIIYILNTVPLMFV